MLLHVAVVAVIPVDGGGGGGGGVVVVVVVVVVAVVAGGVFVTMLFMPTTLRLFCLWC